MGGLPTPPVGIGLTDLAKSGGGSKYPFTLRSAGSEQNEKKKLDEVEN